MQCYRSKSHKWIDVDFYGLRKFWRVDLSWLILKVEFAARSSFSQIWELNEKVIQIAKKNSKWPIRIKHKLYANFGTFFFRKRHPHSEFEADLCDSEADLGFSVNPQNRKLLHFKVSRGYPEISSEKTEI